ncbi:ATP-dependent zinc protease family protein [Catenovulum sediminis]|uniref:ATP-dependent zinc protease n=1 Tax=Catenovulum sediminis TaxID=1740262 RepID=A0ABV1RNC8_9ALTE
MDFLNIRSILVCGSVTLFSGCALLQDSQPLSANNKNQINTAELVQMIKNNTERQLTQNDKLLKQNAQLKQQLTNLTKQIAEQPKSEPEQVQCHSSASETNGKAILGEVEWVYLPAIKKHLKARIDSGATTSSISATNIERFERDGEAWARFDMVHFDSALSVPMEARIVRTARIRQASFDKIERRIVVNLSLFLGEKLQQEAEFTLADRSEMDFPILLGREFLQDITLIDVGKQFLHAKYTEDKEG